MKKNAAKRALLMSTISLLLCVSMLVGTTFAWFTDSVTSGSNIIAAGNLDVAMYWADGTLPTRAMSGRTPPPAQSSNTTTGNPAIPRSAISRLPMKAVWH